MSALPIVVPLLSATPPGSKWVLPHANNAFNTPTGQCTFGQVTKEGCVCMKTKQQDTVNLYTCRCLEITQSERTQLWIEREEESCEDKRTHLEIGIAFLG